MQLQFHWDDDDTPRARGKGHGRALAGFLESDLQDSPAAAREVLRALDRVESGQEPSWERTGNAYTLTLSPDGATIQDEQAADAEPHAVPLAALREAVSGWVSFLEEKRRT
ncbi:MAG TPA: YacL family protein [Thermoanaerobaculia bacterium]|nr:YacL family protein [Thermoanaerobaculia bacterium]